MTVCVPGFSAGTLDGVTNFASARPSTVNFAPGGVELTRNSPVVGVAAAGTLAVGVFAAGALGFAGFASSGILTGTVTGAVADAAGGSVGFDFSLSPTYPAIASTITS